MSPSWEWPWQFVSVSGPEKQQRRELLDLRGYIAQCSVLAVVVAIRAFQSYQAWAGNRAEDAVRRRPPRGRQQSWWNQPFFRRGMETRKHYLVCSIWLGWLLSLSVWRTGNDYLHFTKALGQVGLSQLPLQVLLAPGSYFSASKPVSPSIMSFLTSVPQPHLTPYHRLYGRVVLTPLLLGHVVLYLAFFAQSATPNPAFGSLLAKRIRDPDVQWGLGAVGAAAVVLFVLTRPLRQRSRGMGPGLGQGSGLDFTTLVTGSSSSVNDQRWRFYIAHVLLVGVFCLAMYWHVAQAKPYVLETLGSFVLSLFL